MIVFLQFKNIGSYEMGKPQINIWNRDTSNALNGPRFASADWVGPERTEL